MSRRVSCLVLTVALLPTLAQAIALPALPAGMCALNEKQPEQALIMQHLQSANAGSNTVLATFARCDELAALTAKKSSSISHYGSILSQSLGQSLPMDRATYIETAATLYAASGKALTETALTGAREATAIGAKSSGIDNPKAITAESEGVLFKNKDMLIIGMKQTNSFGSQVSYVSSTAAMTLIGGEPISVNLYAPVAEATQSRAALQAFIPTLIAANP